MEHDSFQAVQDCGKRTHQDFAGISQEALSHEKQAKKENPMNGNTGEEQQRMKRDHRQTGYWLLFILKAPGNAVWLRYALSYSKGFLGRTTLVWGSRCQLNRGRHPGLGRTQCEDCIQYPQPSLLGNRARQVPATAGCPGWPQGRGHQKSRPLTSASREPGWECFDLRCGLHSAARGATGAIQYQVSL